MILDIFQTIAGKVAERHLCARSTPWVFNMVFTEATGLSCAQPIYMPLESVLDSKPTWEKCEGTQSVWQEKLLIPAAVHSRKSTCSKTTVKFQTQI